LNQNSKIIRRLAGIFDMSAQQLQEVPIVELAGTKRALIENHRGVISYSKELVCILVKYGKVCVSGFGLEICQISKHQLVISGDIQGVQLERGIV
jgi:sporulation protein YqfC